MYCELYTKRIYLQPGRGKKRFFCICPKDAEKATIIALWYFKFNLLKRNTDNFQLRNFATIMHMVLFDLTKIRPNTKFSDFLFSIQSRSLCHSSIIGYSESNTKNQTCSKHMWSKMGRNFWILYGSKAWSHYW